MLENKRKEQLLFPSNLERIDVFSQQPNGQHDGKRHIEGKVTVWKSIKGETASRAV